MQKRYLWLISLVCIGFILGLVPVVHATLFHLPRYAMVGGSGGGPTFRRSNGSLGIAWIREMRVDRWTGVTEERGVNYGQPTEWRTIGWNPLLAFVR